MKSDKKLYPEVHLMLDIETMGNTPGSAIKSIGAVFIKDGALGDEFYELIDLESCIKAGLHMDTSTVMWWLKQSDEARKAIYDAEGMPVAEAMIAFNAWVVNCMRDLGGIENVQVWGNSSTFDVVLVEEACRKLDLQVSWKFFGHRCYRTLKNLFAGVPKPPDSGVRHHALHDAKWQALHLINILQHINSLQNATPSATTAATDHEAQEHTKTEKEIRSAPGETHAEEEVQGEDRGCPSCGGDGSDENGCDICHPQGASQPS